MRERARTGFTAAGLSSATAESVAACICLELRRQYAIGRSLSLAGPRPAVICTNVTWRSCAGSEILAEFPQDFAFPKAERPYRRSFCPDRLEDRLNLRQNDEEPGPGGRA